jgi:hypothetical protein
LLKLSLKSPRLVDDLPRESLERANFQAPRTWMHQQPNVEEEL